jgi:hypothetical protein
LVQLTSPEGLEHLRDAAGHPREQSHAGSGEKPPQAVRHGAADERVDPESADRFGAPERAGAADVDLGPADVAVPTLVDHENAVRRVEHRGDTTVPDGDSNAHAAS